MEQAVRKKQRSAAQLAHELKNFSLLDIASKIQRKDFVGV